LTSQRLRRPRHATIVPASSDGYRRCALAGGVLARGELVRGVLVRGVLARGELARGVLVSAFLSLGHAVLVSMKNWSL
jgi:hypothetical protein